MFGHVKVSEKNTLDPSLKLHPQQKLMRSKLWGTPFRGFCVSQLKKNKTKNSH